jgi:hypothetical protein
MKERISNYDYLYFRWSFNANKSKNGIYLRHSNFDLKVDKDLSLIFEFIVHIRESETNVLTISSCFGEVPF